MEAKMLKKERRRANHSASIIDTLKPLWEVVRRKDPKPNSEELRKFFDLVYKNILEIAYKHEGSRIIESAIKLCDKEKRPLLIESLKGHFLEFSKSKYAKHIVLYILKHYPTHKYLIFSEIEGHIEECIKHSDAAVVIDTLFSDCCSPSEHNVLMLEFYGREFVLFKDTYRQLDLQGIVAKDAAKKPFIQARLRAILESVLKKGNLYHSVTHRLLRDYVCIANKDKDFMTWMDELMPHLKQVLHTLDGVGAALQCLALANAKGRKRFIKSLCDKDSLVNDLHAVFTDLYGHVAILGIFSLVDDTVLINETITKQLEKEFTAYIQHKQASKLIHFLFAGGKSTRLLTQQVVSLLHAAEDLTTTTKKPIDLRISQIRQPLIAKYVEHARGNLLSLIRDAQQAPILADFLNVDSALLPELCLLMSPQLLKSENLVRQFLKRYIRRANPDSISQLYASLEPFVGELLGGDAAYVLVAMAQSSEDIRGQLCRNPTFKQLYEGIPKY
jgi:pumilio family protein 6